MLLFDIIRDWFVMYIWGGMASDFTEYSCSIGHVLIEDGIADDLFFTNNLGVSIGQSTDVLYGYGAPISKAWISLGDWLSTTSTIIVLCLLCAFLIMCVIWLFKFFGGIFKW